MMLLAADKRTKKRREHLRLRFNQTGNNATFTRSDIGNISNVNLNGTGAARSYSDVHELTSLGGQTQIFDADGNLVTHSSSMTLGWDDAGRLETASPDSSDYDGTVTLGYDASGKRSFVTKTPNGGSAATTVYIYAGPNCIAEYNSGTAAASPDVEFVYAAGGAGLGIDSLVLVDDGSSELAVLRNQQWSVTALVNNSTGSVAERYAYDHFGKRTIYAANGTTIRTVSSHKNPYGHTSRRHDDETGLMYYRARYYDSATGEFISKDPLEYVDGMSQYRGYFVPGAVDPSGREIDYVKHQGEGDWTYTRRPSGSGEGLDVPGRGHGPGQDFDHEASLWTMAYAYSFEYGCDKSSGQVGAKDWKLEWKNYYGTMDKGGVSVFVGGFQRESNVEINGGTETFDNPCGEEQGNGHWITVTATWTERASFGINPGIGPFYFDFGWNFGETQKRVTTTAKFKHTCCKCCFCNSYHETLVLKDVEVQTHSTPWGLGGLKYYHFEGKKYDYSY